MAIEINKLTLSIANKKICDSLSVKFDRGESWAILGINGVGKSTFLHHIIDIDQAKADEVIIDNKPLSLYTKHRKALAQKTGILLQDYEFNFPCSVLESVLIGRHPYKSQWQWDDVEDIRIAEHSLERMCLLELKERNIDSLSGGEKRRLNMATLLTQNPDFLLLDEPTNHLDLNAQVMMLDLIKEQVTQHNKGAVMVIHDANLARRYCDKVLMLFGNGEWAAGDSSELINADALQRLYGCVIKTFSNEEQTVFLPG